jgi:hypothetical protein
MSNTVRCYDCRMIKALGIEVKMDPNDKRYCFDCHRDLDELIDYFCISCRHFYCWICWNDPRRVIYYWTMVQVCPPCEIVTVIEGKNVSDGSAGTAFGDGGDGNLYRGGL